MDNIKFYNDTMGNEQLICSCSDEDFMSYPNKMYTPTKRTQPS